MIGRTNASKSTTGSSRRLWMIVAALAALALCFPIDATTAYLTSMKDAPTTTGGVGRWCAVPDPKTHPNVYQLTEFGKSGFGTRMNIVPVIRRGNDFGPGGGDGHLGVRAWACNDSALTSSSNIKVTAWRTPASPGTLYWLPRVGGNSAASHRLDPENGLGDTLNTLHRSGSKVLDITEPYLSFSDRQQYAWIMSSNRTKSNRNANPPCIVPACTTLPIYNTPTFSSGFNADSGESQTPENSVTYMASAYWDDAGKWTGGLVSAPTLRDVKLQTYAGPQPPFSNGSGPTSTDGRQVQWVVMEWWGSTTPTDDMVLEVFVQ